MTYLGEGRRLAGYQAADVHHHAQRHHEHGVNAAQDLRQGAPAGKRVTGRLSRCRCCWARALRGHRDDNAYLSMARFSPSDEGGGEGDGQGVAWRSRRSSSVMSTRSDTDRRVSPERGDSTSPDRSEVPDDVLPDDRSSTWYTPWARPR